MNFREGQTYVMTRGTKARVGRSLGAGGEGCVHEATDRRDGSRGVVKMFTDSSPERAQRTQFLVDLNLSALSRLCYAPKDWLVNGSVIHYSPYAEGVSLEEHLETPGNSFPENCKIGIALCHGLTLLAEHGLGHGDIQLKNFIVQKTATGFEVALIDFDNFIAPGAPPPLSIGQEHMLAPELRTAYKAGRPIPPDLLSDRYALAVLLHDVLLAKHVAHGFDDDPDQFDACMLSGRWWHDPALGRGPDFKGTGGYPSGILDPDLARLFRRGLSLNREDRPTPAEWRDTFCRSFERIYVHPRCGGPVFADTGKQLCPFCGERYRQLKLVFTGLGRELSCAAAVIPVGRHLLPSPNVSAAHAVIRRIGPLVTVQSLGRNGSYRFVDGHWVRFEHAVIEAGEQLRFADVVARVEEVAA